MILDVLVLAIQVLQNQFLPCNPNSERQKLLVMMATILVGGFVWIVYYILINWLLNRVLVHNFN